MIVSEICKKIKNCDFFCADITQLNPNVLFEIGYAIARNKRIWLVRDTSFIAANSDFQKLKTLTTIGYCEYVNSKDIFREFCNDLPHESTEETVFDEVIQPTIMNVSEQHIFYVKSNYEDEASIKVSQQIQTTCSNSAIRLVVDDPTENASQPLSWYASNIYSARAVVCHPTTQQRASSLIHNAKHSLIAGLAHGLEVPLLLLIESDLFGPMDYRDLLISYSRASEAAEATCSFLEPAVKQAREIRYEERNEKIKDRNIEQLSLLNIGEPIAEHEDLELIETAFVKTATSQSALDGSESIFVGRKGVGKSATFKYLSVIFRQDKRNVVCEIKPLSYELESLLEVAQKFQKLSKKSFLFESLWKFLIYSELAKQQISIIENRISNQVFKNEEKLIKLVAEFEDIIMLDFSARLDLLSKKLISLDVRDYAEPSAMNSVAEELHSSLLPSLLTALVEAHSDKKAVVVLVDNLDKAWDKGENTQLLSYFLLGLLSAVRRITSEFRSKSGYDRDLVLRECIFIREDIFNIVLKKAREPDKIIHHRISWDDPGQLLYLANNRLRSASGITDGSTNQLWGRFFEPMKDGSHVVESILPIILPRPRDLLYFLRSAINTAVKRRHEKVQLEDLLAAEGIYSDFAYQSVVVELLELYPRIEDILAEFLGGSAILASKEIASLFSDICDDHDECIKTLTLVGFLQLEVPNRGFVSVLDEVKYLRYLKAAEKAAVKNGQQVKFKIHRAYWNSLVLDNSV